MRGVYGIKGAVHDCSFVCVLGYWSWWFFFFFLDRIPFLILQHVYIYVYNLSLQNERLEILFKSLYQ